MYAIGPGFSGSHQPLIRPVTPNELISAIQEGNLAAVKRLAEPKTLKPHVLHAAVMYMQYEILEWLLKEQKYDCENDCFRAACEKNDTKSIELFIEYYPKILYKSIFTSISEITGQTPMEILFHNGQYELIKKLVQKDSELLMTRWHGILPLAVKAQNVDFIKYLLDLKIEELFYANDINYNTGLSCAVKTDRIDLVSLILSYKPPHDVIASPLNDAIVLNQLETVKLFFSYGFDVNMFNTVLNTSLLYDAIRCKHPKIQKFLLEKGARVIDDEGIPNTGILCVAINTNNLEIMHLIDSQLQRPFDYSKFLCVSLNIEMNKYLLAKIFPDATEFLQRLYDLNLGSIFGNRLSYFSDLAKQLCKTSAEWNEFISDLETIISIVQEKSFSYNNQDPKTTINWIFIQLFVHICGGTNPKLSQKPHFLAEIAGLLSESSSEDLDLIFIGLQTSSNISSIKRARRRFHDSIPGKEQFKKYCRSDMIDWLCYISIYRSRQGLGLCLYAIKHHSNDDLILKYAISAIRKIGITQFNEAGQNKIIDALSKNSQPNTPKALWSLHRNPNDLNLLTFFYNQLKESSNKPVSRKFLNLIKVMGNFNLHLHPPSTELLIKLLKDPTPQVRIQATFALSKSSHIQGLLAALEVVKSSDWEKYDDHYGSHTTNVEGDFDLFRSRPHGKHDNRLAMIDRIKDRLVNMFWKDGSFREYLSHFHPDNSPAVKAAVKCFKTFEHTRFIGAPIYFPEKTFLARGIGSRKGENAFYESVIDLILKGCGSSDLSTGDAKVDGGTWCKIGHVFCTHEVDLFNDRNPYFTGINAALIVFSAEHYNEAYLRGNARVENEFTINPILYGGISQDQIAAIFIHKRHQKDLIQLSGDDSINHPCLTSEFFKSKSIKELKQLRRHLKPIIGKIQYFDSSNPVTSARLKKQFRFASKFEVLNESKKRLLAREHISSFLKLDPVLFMAQDQMLAHLYDKDFKSHRNTFFKMMCPEMKAMGTYSEEVLFGSKGGFGLHTDFIGTSRRRKILRIAALLCNTGKLELLQAEKILKKRFQFLGIDLEDIPLIISLIEHHDIFGRFTHSNSQLSIQDIKKLCDVDIYCQILLSLYLAIASTRHAVQQRRHIYQPILENINNLDFETFDWLIDLREKLQNIPKSKL